MTDKKWLVPDVIDPAEKVCVSIEIPNDLKHIAAFWGALEQLGKAYNWEDSFVDGSATAYVWQDVLEGASEAVRVGENCMLDCEDVEDCLGTSTIINLIAGDITTNETNITNNETNITINEGDITTITGGGVDTNVYPDLPTLQEPDLLCGASYRIAQELIDFVEQTVLDVIAIAADAWVLGILFLGNWTALTLMIFWDYILDNEPSLSGVDFDVYLDQLAEAFYCAELDIDQAIADLDPAIPELHRNALIYSFQGITFAQVALWAFVGGLDDSNDCSSFDCPWCYEWDFTTGISDWTIIAGSAGANGLEDGTFVGSNTEQHASIVLMAVTGMGITEIEVWGHHEIKLYFVAGWNEEFIYCTSHGDIVSNPKSDGTDDPIYMHPTGLSGLTGNLQIGGRHGIKRLGDPDDISTTSGYINKIILRGIGPNPFGPDNCT